MVILGAGASRAAFPSGDRNGLVLPLMDDLIDAIGIDELIPESLRLEGSRNFESVYERLVAMKDGGKLVTKVERAVEHYFAQLELPDVPTIYDYLVLGLRHKDMIATFNWDPLLMQAWQRNRWFTEDLPHLRFLHGNVANGYCNGDETLGVFGFLCPTCDKPFERSRLLYPVSQKNYVDDPAIAKEWENVHSALDNSFMITIFGYGSPSSDEGAKQLMAASWGRPEDNKLERIEIIDIRDPSELVDEWKSFVFSNHYGVYRQFEESWIARHPRRTNEAFFAQFIEAKPVHHRSFPEMNSLEELREWFSPLIDAESKFDSTSN